MCSQGYVVIQADVDEDFALSNWEKTIVATAGDDTKEIGFTTTGTIRQNKLRLLIGKITLGTGSAPTAWQAQLTSVKIVHGVLNGVAIKTFIAAPTAAEAI